MKQTKGKANPKMLNEMFLEELKNKGCFRGRGKKHLVPKNTQINLFFKESTTIPQTKNSTENNKLISKS